MKTLEMRNSINQTKKFIGKCQQQTKQKKNVRTKDNVIELLYYIQIAIKKNNKQNDYNFQELCNMIKRPNSRRQGKEGGCEIQNKGMDNLLMK